MVEQSVNTEESTIRKERKDPEKMKEFRRKLDTVTQIVIDESNGLVGAVVYFGSRVDPNRQTKGDSDLDYMIVTNEYVGDSLPTRRAVKSKVKQALKLRGDCHVVMPKGNIEVIRQRMPTFWKDNRIDETNSHVSGSPGIVKRIKATIKKG